MQVSAIASWCSDMAQGASAVKATNQQGRPLLVYFGHHKCASTWLGDIVTDMSAAAGLSVASVHNPRGFGGDLASFVETRRPDVLLYRNANYEQVSKVRNFRGFHVIRDPRD